MEVLKVGITDCIVKTDKDGSEHTFYEIHAQGRGMEKSQLRQYKDFAAFDAEWRKIFNIDKTSLNADIKKRLQLTGSNAKFNPFVKGMTLAKKRMPKLETYLMAMAETPALVPYLEGWLQLGDAKDLTRQGKDGDKSSLLSVPKALLGNALGNAIGKGGPGSMRGSKIDDAIDAGEATLDDAEVTA